MSEAAEQLTLEAPSESPELESVAAENLGRLSLEAAEVNVHLSPRETEMLGFLALGMSNNQIAKQEWVVESTVKYRLNSIYKKMNVKNRTEAVSTAQANGLLPPAEPTLSVLGLRKLTKRRIEVLGLVAEGLSNSEVAARLGVGEKTVRYHLYETYKKLGVHTRTQASQILLASQQIQV